MNISTWKRPVKDNELKLTPENTPSLSKSPLIPHPFRSIAVESILSLSNSSILSPVLHILPADIEQIVDKYHFKFFAKKLFNEQKTSMYV
jgi:hypothetical protein